LVNSKPLSWPNIKQESGKSQARIRQESGAILHQKPTESLAQTPILLTQSLALSQQVNQHSDGYPINIQISLQANGSLHPVRARYVKNPVFNRGACQWLRNLILHQLHYKWAR
jgi:hypothetical protein